MIDEFWCVFMPHSVDVFMDFLTIFGCDAHFKSEWRQNH